MRIAFMILLGIMVAGLIAGLILFLRPRPLPTVSVSDMPPSTSPVPTGWQRWTEARWRFQLDYPPNTAVQVVPLAPALRPMPLARFVVVGDGTSSEAQFTISVYPNDKRLPLRAWLDAHQLSNPQAGWQLSAATISGQQGLRVDTQTFQLPGVFFYVAQGAYVYGLTPIDPASDQILPTFTLLPP